MPDQDLPPEGDMAPPFTDNLSRSRGFAGYAVKCPDLLLLYEHKFPFTTEAEAEEALRNVEKFGACPFEHRVVKVYHVRSGRVPRGHGV